MYDSSRVSSEGQQVTAYSFRDDNNVWKLFPVDNATLDEVNLNFELEEPARLVRNNDTVRIYHVSTDSFLFTHDVASPLTATHQEVTCINQTDSEKWPRSKWRVHFDDSSNLLWMTVRCSLFA